jgi:hypothetical protein
MATEKTTPTGAPIANCSDLTLCEVVSCALCLAEVPTDLAVGVEGPAYVQYFCGLDCLALWQAKAASER